MPVQGQQSQSVNLFCILINEYIYIYRCETWTCYRQHLKDLGRFQLRHLRILLNIKWQDRVTNAEVLKRSQNTGVEALLVAAQLRWTGHVWRMGDERIPKQLLYGELRDGERHQGCQKAS